MNVPFSFLPPSFWPIQLIISMGSLYFCYTTPSCNCTHPLGSRWSLLFLTGTGFYNRSNKFHVNVFKETDNVILLSPTGFAASQRTLNHLIKGHTVKNCSVEARSKDFGAQSVIKSSILKSYFVATFYQRQTSVTKHKEMANQSPPRGNEAIFTAPPSFSAKF